MSFLVAAGDYPDVFPGGWRPRQSQTSSSACSRQSELQLVITLMSFLVAAGGYPDVFPGGCW